MIADLNVDQTRTEEILPLGKFIHQRENAFVHLKQTLV